MAASSICATGEIRVAGVGDIRLERRRREPAQLGAPRRRDLSDRQQDRPPRRLRPQLRPRRVRIALRPQRDAEPAGAVGAGAQRAGKLRPRVHARAGTAAAGLPDGPAERPVPAARRRVRARPAGEAAAADGGCVQRDRAASVERHACRSRPGTSATGAETSSRATARPSTSTSPRSWAIRMCPRTTGGRFSPAASPTISASAGRSAGRRGSTFSATARTTRMTRCRRSSTSGSRAGIP